MELRHEAGEFINKMISRSALLQFLAAASSILIFAYPMMEVIYTFLSGFVPASIILLFLEASKWLFLLMILICFAQDKNGLIFWSAIAEIVILVVESIKLGWSTIDAIDAIVYCSIALWAYKSYKGTQEYAQFKSKVSTVANGTAQKLGTAGTQLHTQVAHAAQAVQTKEPFQIKLNEKQRKTCRKSAYGLVIGSYIIAFILPFVRYGTTENTYGIISEIIHIWTDLVEFVELLTSNATILWSSIRNVSMLDILAIGVQMQKAHYTDYSIWKDDSVILCTVLLIAGTILTVATLCDMCKKPPQKIKKRIFLLAGCYVLVTAFQHSNAGQTPIYFWSWLPALLTLLVLPLWQIGVLQVSAEMTNLNLKKNKTALPGELLNVTESSPSVPDPEGPIPIVSETDILPYAEEEDEKKTSAESFQHDEKSEKVIIGAKERPVFCGNCGAKLLPDSVFCQECGSKI